MGEDRPREVLRGPPVVRGLRGRAAPFLPPATGGQEGSGHSWPGLVLSGLVWPGLAWSVWSGWVWVWLGLGLAGLVWVWVWSRSGSGLGQYNEVLGQYI